MFLILHIDEDGKGGSFLQSSLLKIECNDVSPYHIKGSGPDIVSGILAHWVFYCTPPPNGYAHSALQVPNSFKDIGPDDWFTVETGPDCKPAPRRARRSKSGDHQKEGRMVRGVVDS